MNPPMALTRNQQFILALLLGITMLGALLASSEAVAWTTLPGWVGGVTALAALFGVLLVFWRSGALRAPFLILLGAAFAVAALAGLL